MTYAVTAEDLILLREYRRRASLRAQSNPPLAAYVEQTTAFKLEAWQQKVCKRLQDIIDLNQTGVRLLIHGPPQFGKSLVISQRFPAYALGRRPLWRLRTACYNVTHAERFSKVNLELMRAPDYPFRTKVPARCAVDEWSTTDRAALNDANPSMKALGLGSGFVGLGADLLIIDDPYKNAQEARSPAVNVMLWDWWTQTVLSRLNEATNVVVMFHRWWDGDFAGRLIEQGGWEQLRFPAIADGGEHDPTEREQGAPLSPRYSLDYLAQLRASMGTAFEALYQGRPYPAEGAMFKAGKVDFIDAAPVQATRVRRWDIAASANTGDYTAGVLMSYVAPGLVFVEDVQRGQWATDERDRKIREIAELDRARGAVTHILPQDPGAAGKDQAAHFTRLLGGYSVSTERESGDKVTRADPLASQWNAGNVKLVRGAWNQPYLDELFAFPNGKHDDQVDGSSGAYNHLAQNRRAFSHSYDTRRR